MNYQYTACLRTYIHSSKVVKIFSALYPGFATEKVKRPFLTSKVSACNLTLCREQQVARELRVGQGCSSSLILKINLQ